MNEATSEPEYTALCEICSSPDQVALTADPDRGGLQLCHECAVLFGFEDEQGE